MANPRVYLAGPIESLSYDEAVTWRNQVQEALREVGIVAYSPMRGKSQLADVRELKAEEFLGSHYLTTSKAIIARDFRDCTTADAVLVNLKGYNKTTLGSVAELAWCYDRNIPVVAVVEEDNSHYVHPFGQEMIDIRVDTMAEGIEAVKSLLLPGGAV